MTTALLRNLRGQTRVGAVRELPNGDIAISKGQRNVHVFFEAMALPAAGIMAYIAATNKMLVPWQRGFLYTTAAVTVVVDGGLLVSYMRKKK